MTVKEFCRIYSSYYGEEIDKVGQLTYASFSGEELKEFIEHAIYMHKTLKPKRDESNL